MEVSYRNANPDDLQLFFNWANDPEARANSYNSNLISLAEHTDWYLRKINDHHTLFYIAEVANHPAGMVRFDIKIENAIVSISIDKNFRRKGLAAVLLTDCCQYYFEKQSNPVHAYIKSTNLASVQSFKKAGFMFFRNETVNEVESQIFIKEKKNE